jgi:hypothetical protein
MPDDASDRLTVNAWLALVREHLPQDVELELTPAERRVLLELAGVAAHASERVAAPLSTFLVGLALHDVRGPRRAEAIVDLTRRLRQRVSATAGSRGAGDAPT